MKNLLNLLAASLLVVATLSLSGCYALAGENEFTSADDKKYEEEDIGGISGNTDTTISWGDICPKVGEPCDKGDVCDHNFTSDKHQCRPIHTAHEGESCTGTVGKLGSHTSLTNQYLCVEGLVCDDKNGWPETCRVPDPCEFCTPEQACVELVCKDDIMSPLEHQLFEMVQKYELAGDTVWQSEWDGNTAQLSYKKVGGRWEYDLLEMDGGDSIGFLTVGCDLKVDDSGFSCIYDHKGWQFGIGYNIKSDKVYKYTSDTSTKYYYFKRQNPSK